MIEPVPTIVAEKIVRDMLSRITHPAVTVSLRADVLAGVLAGLDELAASRAELAEPMPASPWRTTTKPIAWRVSNCTPPAVFMPGEPSESTVQYWSGIGVALEYAYAAAPAPRPLTAEQKRAMWMGTPSRGNGGQADWYRLGIEDAEQAHGITEAPAAGSTS